MKSLTHIFLITISFLALTGCSLKDSDERSHPLFKRAVKAQQSNEIKLAITYFNRYLSLKPDSSRTHLRLASLYDENLDKPLRAVYHYERFLEFSPNSPETDNVKKWKAAALRKYYYRTRQEFNDPEDVGILQNTLYLTEQKLKKRELEIKKIKSLQKKLILYARKIRNNEKILKTELSNLQKTHQQTLEEMEKLRTEFKEKSVPKEKEEKKEEKKKDIKNAETKVLEKKETKKTEVKAEVKVEEKPKVKPEEKKKEERKSLQVIPKAAVTVPADIIKKTVKTEVKSEIKPDIKIRFYTVKRGDSLSNISRQFYGSSKYYKLIFEANREILPSEKDLRPGQVLKIPQL